MTAQNIKNILSIILVEGSHGLTDLQKTDLIELIRSFDKVTENSQSNLHRVTDTNETDAYDTSAYRNTSQTQDDLLVSFDITKTDFYKGHRSRVQELNDKTNAINQLSFEFNQFFSDLEEEEKIKDLLQNIR